MSSLIVRPETPADCPAVSAVNCAAFERDIEAELVDTLRAACPKHLSLVAEQDGAIVGHVLFTPVHVECAGAALEGMGLAPLAVAPAHQSRGVGAALVTAGLERLRAEGCPYAIVLGHPGYYPRFGFIPAVQFGLRCRWDAPEGAFMAIELTPGALEPFRGTLAHYHPAFDNAE